MKTSGPLFIWVKEVVLLWYQIKPETQIALAELFLEMAGYPFIPPVDNWRPGWRVIGRLENAEEIGRLICQTRQHFTRS